MTPVMVNRVRNDNNTFYSLPTVRPISITYTLYDKSHVDGMYTILTIIKNTSSRRKYYNAHIRIRIGTCVTVTPQTYIFKFLPFCVTDSSPNSELELLDGDNNRSFTHLTQLVIYEFNDLLPLYANTPLIQGQLLFLFHILCLFLKLRFSKGHIHNII